MAVVNGFSKKMDVLKIEVSKNTLSVRMLCEVILTAFDTICCGTSKAKHYYFIYLFIYMSLKKGP